MRTIRRLIATSFLQILTDRTHICVTLPVAHVTCMQRLRNFFGFVCAVPMFRCHTFWNPASSSHYWIATCIVLQAKGEYLAICMHFYCSYIYIDLFDCGLSLYEHTLNDLMPITMKWHITYIYCLHFRSVLLILNLVSLFQIFYCYSLCCFLAIWIYCSEGAISNTQCNILFGEFSAVGNFFR